MKNKEYIELEKLVDCIIDNRGKTVPTSNTGIPLIATNCIKFSSLYPVFENVRYINEDTYENWFRSHLQPDDILFVNKGTPGRCCLVPDPVNFVGAQDMVGLRFKKHLNPYYMLAILRSKEILKTIENNHVGLVIAHFRKQELVKLKLPIVSCNLRNKIGDFYRATSVKIELNNKINTELEKMAKTLYDYWFVQFDFPDANGKPYKSSGGEMVNNAILKRAIPKSWEVKNLSSFIGNDKSGDWGKENKEGNYIQKVECVRGADINGINGKGEIKAPTRYILEKNSHKILAPNDFVVEISGGSPVQSTGRIACITDDVLQRFSNPLICSNFCKAVSLNSSDEVFYFLCSWNRAYDNSILFSFEGKTSGIKNLLFDDFVTAYMVAKPTECLLKEFNEKISLFEKKRQENLKQNQELAQLRDWLLPMLMNGQVTVGDAEEMVNEIV
jgi:type I restriction enzyme S subunit